MVSENVSWTQRPVCLDSSPSGSRYDTFVTLAPGTQQVRHSGPIRSDVVGAGGGLRAETTAQDAGQAKQFGFGLLRLKASGEQATLGLNALLLHLAKLDARDRP